MAYTAVPAGSGGSGLSPIPDQTALINISGGSAIPTAGTVAQILTMLGLSSFADIRATTLLRAQALCGATLNVLTGTEFDSTSDYAATLVSSGTGALSVVDKGGVLIASTGATANSSVTVNMAGVPSLIDNAKTSRWYAVYRAKWATAVDAASQLDVRLIKGGNTLVAFGQAGGIGTTNFRVRVLDGAGSTITNAAVTQAVDTAWHTIEMYNDGTNIAVACDAVTQFTGAASAWASGDPIGLQILVANGGTAANRQINCDRMCVAVAGN